MKTCNLQIHLSIIFNFCTKFSQITSVILRQISAAVLFTNTQHLQQIGFQLKYQRHSSTFL
jgi:hypothetical protein